MKIELSRVFYPWSSVLLINKYVAAIILCCYRTVIFWFGNRKVKSTRKLVFSFFLLDINKKAKYKLNIRGQTIDKQIALIAWFFLFKDSFWGDFVSEN